MKKTLCVFILTLVFLLNGYGQLQKSSTQFGTSFLPIYDVLNFFPNNHILGIAATANFGVFLTKNLSVGIEPFYGQVSNSYTSRFFEKETQEIKLYGLNTYLRYYFITNQKFLFYSYSSAGFGNSEQKTINLATSILIENSRSNSSVFVFMLGLGVNYFIVKNLSLELKVPYINIKYFSTNLKDTRFQTAAPTIGLQYYLK